MHRREFLAGSGALLAAGAAGSYPAVAAAAPAQTAAAASGTAGSAYSAGTEVKRLSIVNLEELAERAKAVIPPAGHDQIAQGSGAEWTLRENRAAFERIPIEPQHLEGVNAVDMSVTLLGSKLPLPILIPPMGSHGLAHVSKEEGTARGAAAVGAMFVLSGQSNLSMEEVAATGPGPRWMQLYFPKDLGYAREFTARTKAAGYTALVVTVDTVANYPREASTRNAFRAPASLGKGNAPLRISDPELARAAMEKKPDLTMADVVWLKRESGLPVIVKGVLSPKTAIAALEHGLDGVWVSNHGGRALDGVGATIDQLPRIADALQGRIPLILDSGVRRGPDVFRALALGADAVAVGRPILYGLALGGWMGVQSVLEHIANELDLTMKNAGTLNLASITREYLAPPFHT